jgi:heme/copper-type cytochrome/quinol oxidase subunit 2
MSRTAIRNVILILVLLVILVGLFLWLRPSPTQEDGSVASESTGAAQSQEQTFDLAIQNGSMTPTEISVSEGDQVTFRITSDRPLEFHLHGYDLEKEVEANQPAELSFDATTTGRFAIEDHDTEAELGALLVQPR